jgi:ubiquinone/menaquinone biosynthesis C-methylase UbiE
MLQRILEPEVMDSSEEARDYDSMDHADVNRQFVADFLAAASKPEGNREKREAGSVLDLGTGTAQIPIELCRRTDRFSVVAVDAARNMLVVAAENVAADGLADRIQLRLGDAKSLPFDDAAFEAVTSNSIVHHLPEPIDALREASRVTRQGGLLFFRDLLRPASEAELAGLVERYAPAASVSDAADHQRAMFDDSLHAALTLEEIRRLVAQIGFEPDSVEQTSDRHWTWIGRKRS